MPKLPSPGPRRTAEAPPVESSAAAATLRAGAGKPNANLQHRLDVLYLSRALRSTATRPPELRPALRRCVSAAKAQPRLFDELLDELGAAAKVSHAVAPRALTAVSEALVMAAGAESRERSGTAATRIPLSVPRHEVGLDGGLVRLVDGLAAHRTSARPVAKHESGGAVEGQQSAAAMQAAEGMLALADAYEEAAAACTAVCVASAVVAPTSGRGHRGAAALPAIGVWATARAPARVDLGGGWTDTPPICYEAGGRVVNLAITVDGVRPIGARARRLAHYLVRIAMRGAPPLVLRSVADLSDRFDPRAPGALAKAVLVVTGAVDAGPEAPSLQEQLAARGGGLEVHAHCQPPLTANPSSAQLARARGHTMQCCAPF